MKDRNFICEFYMHEGGCSMGKEGTFRKKCQTCNKYKAKRGAAPARKNLKKQKQNRDREREMKRHMRDF